MVGVVPQPSAGGLSDTLGRPLRDLRISVTDRCNFRCPYCMPKEVFGREFHFLERSQLLTFEEIARVVRVAAGLGVRKVRLTGGEPLLRRDLERLVTLIAAVNGIDDIALTTNGVLLAGKAKPLRAAGLSRVTVSLDSLDDATFRTLNGVDASPAPVLEGIAAAQEAGLSPIKLNTVIKRGVNEDSVVDLARYARRHGCILRVIEYMDVGASNGWRLDDVVPAAEVMSRIDAEMPLEPLDPQYRGEVAQRYRYRDGGGEVGFIASVTQPFCGDCSRARLAADGVLHTCLFATAGHDLRPLLRSGCSEAALEQELRRIWSARDDRYSDLRSAATAGLRKVEMSYIGG
jgi:cyclic pyranopterin phosphate synthase